MNGETALNIEDANTPLQRGVSELTKTPEITPDPKVAEFLEQIGNALLTIYSRTEQARRYRAIKAGQGNLLEISDTAEKALNAHAELVKMFGIKIKAK